jgi:diguanylate cyclase
MLSSFNRLLSLAAVEAEAKMDRRIFGRCLEAFVRRELINSYLAQFVFAIIAFYGFYSNDNVILIIGIMHFLVDQLVRNNLWRLSESLGRGEIDLRQLRHIEHIFYFVGVVWAMASWPLAQSLDGLRLLLTVVSAAGLLVMANTTCFAPRVLRASIIGFALGIAIAIPAIKTIPSYVFGGAVVAFLVVVAAVGAGTARQLIQMLRMQVERDEAIEMQERIIAELDAARRVATEMAETDSLTGLANRFLFMTNLDALIARGRRFSLTLLDIDLFKNINDSLGHNTGDDVLRAIGSVLSRMHGKGCFAARLGGDEFAVIVAGDEIDISGDEIFLAITHNIDALPRAKLDLPPILITGGSAYFPRDAANAMDLLAAADIAQREAKNTRRGSHIDYNAGLSDIFRREVRIAHAIDEAVASRALFLCFQPKINLETGRVEGAEALSRFSTRSLAGYALDEAFEVAEKRGLATLLDELVLDRYREALLTLRDEFSVVLPTSVNLSGAILKTPDRLLARLNMLIAAGLQPALIRLEITENAICGRGEIGVIEVLDQVVKLGFSIALDDFGTGSGTLRHLLSVPVAEIKIDRSFVCEMLSNVRHSAIVKGLIVTGNQMGVDIVAEGVETLEQAELLRSMGAQFAQGYLWSRAIPLRQFATFVQVFTLSDAPNAVGGPRSASVQAYRK